MLAVLPASIASAAVVNNLIIENIEGTSTTNDYFGDAEGVINDKFSVTLTGTPSTQYTLYFSSQQAAIGEDIGDEVTTYAEWEGLLYTAPGDSAFANTLRIPSSLTNGPDDLTDMHGGTYYFYVTEYHPGSETVAAYSDTRILQVAEFYIHGIAQATIDLNNGYVGDEVVVTGSGFAAEEALIITFANRDISGSVGSPYTEDDGTFELIFDIPESLNGVQKIKITGEDSGAEFEFNFTVKSKLTISPVSGPAGTVLTITGSGFDYRNGIILFINGSVLTSTDITWVLDATYKRTNNYGSFIVTYVIPNTLASGTYTVKAEDEDKNTIWAQTSFEVLLNSVLTISTNTGKVDDTLTVTGTNFSPNANLSILFDTQTVATVTTDSLGNFSKEITVPAAVCGAHLVKVGNTQQTYTVTPKMTLDKTQGIAGTIVTVTGKGFAGGTAITAKFNNAAVVMTPAVTDATGGFVATFTVPANATGTYAVEVTAGNTQTSNFTIVDASIALNVNSGNVGQTITVTGANFGASRNITLTIDGVAIPGVAIITTNATGDFTAQFAIPSIAGGPHTIAVSDGTTSKTSQITVTASATINPISGNVGTSVTVNGSGFSSGGQLTIKYNGTVAATGALPITGAFNNATFPIPASTGGVHNVEVSDGINTVNLTFTMESTAPAAPTLSLPLQASEEKGIVTFDWSDVTDPSLPVTYTLQVATDSGFSAIVIEIAGLTTSTYTLTEAQELPKLADGGQYYWRVKATDGASNSSTSSVNTFTIAGGLPGWLMWVWIGIGVVVVFVFAIWLGRRMAYSAY
jgi:hypothetical protein